MYCCQNLKFTNIEHYYYPSESGVRSFIVTVIFSIVTVIITSFATVCK